MKISCLCVTNRPAFMPWLVWNYAKQTYWNKELIIVSDDPVLWHRTERHVNAKNFVSVGNIAAKRNIALLAATGDAVAWFDDDDWQHPDRLTILAENLTDEYAGGKSSWFMDLESGRCMPYTISPGWEVLFNGALFRTDFARTVRFDESQMRAADTIWMRSLQGKANIINNETLFFWLSHRRNASNPAYSKRFTHDIKDLKYRIGKKWGNTDKHLNSLRKRLR